MMWVNQTIRRSRSAGFTLVELLVVIGIIALLISMLLPAMNRAMQTAKSVNCQSNLRQCGQWLIMYAQENKGWMFPSGLGSNVPAAERWPIYVFKPPIPNPPVMICPADENLDAYWPDPVDRHSYVVNKHLVYEEVLYSKTHGVSASDIVVMGEKKTELLDYYMECDDYGKPQQKTDYYERVELNRHGLANRSNLLFLDGHVDNRYMEKTDPTFLDPWQIRWGTDTGAQTQPVP